MLPSYDSRPLVIFYVPSDAQEPVGEARETVGLLRDEIVRQFSEAYGEDPTPAEAQILTAIAQNVHQYPVMEAPEKTRTREVREVLLAYDRGISLATLAAGVVEDAASDFGRTVLFQSLKDGYSNYGILLTNIEPGQDREHGGFDYTYADRFMAKDGLSMGVTLRPPHPFFAAKVAADADAIALALGETPAFSHKQASTGAEQTGAQPSEGAAGADQGLSKAAVAGLAVAGTALVLGAAFLAFRGGGR